jgi:uncharacterized protein (TIGR03435 family)
MKTTHPAVIAGVAILAALAMATAVKSQSNQTDDSYFDPDTGGLRQVPANLAILRPTHFSDSYAQVRHYHENESLARTVGHDATLKQTIAEAYDCAPAQVVLPADAPQDRYDFLVTKPGHVRAQLQRLIQSELHLTARRETQNTDIFILKVSNSALPGLAVSSADESEDINYKDGKLYFTHKPVSTILDGVSLGLNTPVLDQTGLTNAYDFTLAWNKDAEKRMENGEFTLDGTRKALARWGLSLESTNVPMDMVIVTKTP